MGSRVCCSGRSKGAFKGSLKVDIDIDADIDIVRYFGRLFKGVSKCCLKGVSKSAQVNGIEAAMVLTSTILK